MRLENLSHESFVDLTPERALRKVVDQVFTQHQLSRSSSGRGTAIPIISLPRKRDFAMFMRVGSVRPLTNRVSARSGSRSSHGSAQFQRPATEYMVAWGNRMSISRRTDLQGFLQAGQ